MKRITGAMLASVVSLAAGMPGIAAGQDKPTDHMPPAVQIRAPRPIQSIPSSQGPGRISFTVENSIVRSPSLTPAGESVYNAECFPRLENQGAVCVTEEVNYEKNHGGDARLSCFVSCGNARDRGWPGQTHRPYATQGAV